MCDNDSSCMVEYTINREFVEIPNMKILWYLGSKTKLLWGKIQRNRNYTERHYNAENLIFTGFLK